MGLEFKSSNYNYKLIAIVIIAAASIISFSMITPAIANAPWQQIIPGTITAEAQNENIIQLSLQTAEDVPHVTNLFAGFGWVYDDGTSAFVVTTHNGVRDSVQRPDGWHPHNIAYEPKDIPSSVTHCITDITTEDHAGLPITGDLVRANVRNSQLIAPFMDPLTAISFDIIPDADCPSGVGFGLIDTEPVPAEKEKKGGNPNK